MSHGASSCRPRPRRFSPLGVERLEERIALSLTIDIDYTYDSSGFFSSNPQASTVLQEAATMLGSQLNDSLTAIVPTGGNTWTASTFNPDNPSAELQISNSTIPANTIIVYAGGADLGGDLGLGGSGGFSASGFGDWPNVVLARGQAGALASPPTGFGPWGGSLSFNNTTDWSFAGTGGTPGAGQFDFLSIALHELGHVLGVGTTASWFTDVNTSNNTFIGSHAEASYGGPVPLDTGAGDASADGHWANGTLSHGQITTMNPNITAGTRRLFTSLDWAGLEDIGWQITDQLAMTAEPPVNVSAGVGFGLTVSALDPAGYADPTFHGSVTLNIGNNPDGCTLGGNLTATAANGVATFSGLTLNQDGDGYTLLATSLVLPGVATSHSVDVLSPGIASQIVVETQPAGSVSAGSGFGFAVAVVDAGGKVIPTYTGTVIVSIVSGPAGAGLGGTVSLPVLNGGASFSGLILAQAGSYTLQASANGLTAALTNAITITSPGSGGGGVAPPPPAPPPAPMPPTIIGQQVLSIGRGKKAKVVGFLLKFSAALNAVSAQNAANYLVVAMVKKGRKLVAQGVPFRAVYNAALNSVSLLISVKQAFAKGGKITVVAARPSGIVAMSGAFLDGDDTGVAGDNAVFTIRPNATGVTR